MNSFSLTHLKRQTGARVASVFRRAVYYALEQLCRLHNPLIEKIRHGVYRKTAVGNANAPCTIALSTDNSEGQSSQSAKVQSATQINSDSHE